jgi:hypothetical protein
VADIQLLLGQVFKGELKKVDNKSTIEKIDDNPLDDFVKLNTVEKVDGETFLFVTAASAPAPPQQLGEQNPHIF